CVNQERSGVAGAAAEEQPRPGRVCTRDGHDRCRAAETTKVTGGWDTPSPVVHMKPRWGESIARELRSERE
ncbi:hypothetical protein B8W95_14070, partial [Staphylococcus pasteuri]